ncbi:MAG: fasciclin domain-containing protein [Pseudomonadota bacterium]
MIRQLKFASIVSAALFAASTANAANPQVGGAPMFSDKNIIENAVNSADHTTLVTAVKAADLVDALMGEGPFTVFAPVNDAFAALPDGTVETLLKPENKAQLTKVLTAHVIAGKISAPELRKKAKASSDGFFHLKTLSGDAVSAQVRGDSVYLYDENGQASRITIADVNQSNGVIHVVDKVLLPK